jgi:hypothetical protein
MALAALVLLEIRTYAMQCFGYTTQTAPASHHKPKTYVDRAHTRFDPIRGFRGEEGETRIVRTYNREIIFDSRFHTNHEGFITRQEFTPKKRPGTFRVIVLGDSFSAAGYLNVPWPDRATAALANQGVEFYNFSQDPSDLTPKHRIFFSEVVPRYEFDAVIIPIYDLQRQFRMAVIEPQGETVFLRQFSNSIPKDAEAAREATAVPIMRIRSDAQIDRAIAELTAFHWIKPYPYASEFLWSRLRRKLLTRAPSAVLTGKAAERVAPPTSNTAELEEIISYCRTHDKKVLLSAVPGGPWWLAERRHQNHPRIAETLAAVAQETRVDFFNGYDIYEKSNYEATAATYWLKYDAHWNQKGSDHYAQRLAEYVLKQWRLDAPRALAAEPEEE